MTQDARARLMSFLEERPGSCLQDIANYLGIARTSAIHHVRVLRNDRQIVTQRKGRRVLHFPTAVDDRVHRTILATWRLDTARSILQELEKDPRSSWRAIARNLQITPRAVRWHLQRLEDDGLLSIRRTPDGLRHEAIIHPGVRTLRLNEDLGNWPPGR